MMRKKRIGLVLSVGRLWVMSLPFRLGSRSHASGFAPGMINLLVYEIRRLWHRLYERERLALLGARIRALLSKH